MKVIAHGPFARVQPGELVTSYAPDQPVDVDDTDAGEVAYWHSLADAGMATVTEDVVKPEPPKPTASARATGRKET